jgi:hypothetical protein
MPVKEKSQNSIVVTGDVTMDWNLARERDGVNKDWSADTCSRIWWQRGGAALQADLIAVTAESLKKDGTADFKLLQNAAAHEPIQHGDSRFHHVYTLWTPFGKGKDIAWRVKQFLGLDACTDTVNIEKDDWMQIVDDAIDADIVILDDAALGFRDRNDLWPKAIKDSAHNPWVVLKMSKPVAQGPLWEHLLEHFAERLVVVTTIDDLRQTEVQISRQISWERTAQDTVWELTHNPRVTGLSRCAHVVVSFHTAGSIVLSNHAAGSSQSQLLFDPQVMEDEWEQSNSGGMFGYTTCLVAAIARQLMIDLEQPNIISGVQSGIASMRKLHLMGYGHPGTDPSTAELRFPIHKIVEEISAENNPLSVVQIQDPIKNILSPAEPEPLRVMPGFWTILEDRYTGLLNETAQSIVLNGIAETLDDVPTGRFGALITVDRREIEALRCIRTLITEYCQRPQVRPLSIAVFGPPGSGKSFGVKQIAKSARPGEIQSLTFNISQLGHPDELLDALHQVRDVGLSGKIPLVFWDEFDTPLDAKRLGWLRYFLAPMQDGTFQQGQINHPIGRAIFVFAGGTSHRMDDFGTDLDELERRAAKLPDFISRLKGFIDVLGPNPLEGISDPYFIIRRAIILRVLFELNAPHIFNEDGPTRQVQIDQGILRALLETKSYKHGVRSMESVLAMSMLAGQTSFERSNLPPEGQLNLHVDGCDFLARVQQMNLDGELLETLAEAAHDVFCDGLKMQGFQYGMQSDPELKTHPALMPYESLSEEGKESNRNNVRDIPNKLAIAGYVMIPARSNEPPFDFPGADLELLALKEHERWMATLISTGWCHAPETDRAKKLHSALVDWDELPEEEKEKDRELIRGIPQILAKAGYAIVKSQESCE